MLGPLSRSSSLLRKAPVLLMSRRNISNVFQDVLNRIKGGQLPSDQQQQAQPQVEVPPAPKKKWQIAEEEQSKTIPTMKPTPKVAAHHPRVLDPWTPSLSQSSKSNPLSFGDVLAPQTQVTQLPNGLRIATEETYANACAMGVLVDSGCRHETDITNGASHFLERLAYKSTRLFSGEAIVQNLEKLGGNFASSSSRELQMYHGDVLRSRVPNVLEILSDVVRRPSLSEEDVDEQRGFIQTEYAEQINNPQNLVFELLHQVAYGGRSLGRGLISEPQQTEQLTRDQLAAFHMARHTPKNTVVAAAGIDHNQFVNIVQERFGDWQGNDVVLPTSSSSSLHPSSSDISIVEPAKYIGGEFRVHQLEPPHQPEKFQLPPLTHICVSFEGTSWKNLGDVYTLSVLGSLLGGGMSFSAGGPGKGMYTRVYRNVLNRHGWVYSAQCVNSSFTDSGLFGIHGSCYHDSARRLGEVLCRELARVCLDPIGEEELQRARNQLKSSLFYNLESRQVLFEDIGRQVITYGQRYSPAELCDGIDRVTARDIQETLYRVMNNSKPTIIVFGDTTHVPSYDTFLKYFAGLIRQ